MTDLTSINLMILCFVMCVVNIAVFWLYNPSGRAISKLESLENMAGYWKFLHCRRDARVVYLAIDSSMILQYLIPYGIAAFALLNGIGPFSVHAILILVTGVVYVWNQLQNRRLTKRLKLLALTDPVPAPLLPKSLSDAYFLMSSLIPVYLAYVGWYVITH